MRSRIVGSRARFFAAVPQVEIAKARAHGDLSENAEYHAAKERQGIVNMRLGQLRARLRELSMVDMSKIPRDRVGLGSSVTVLDLEKDQELVYK